MGGDLSRGGRRVYKQSKCDDVLHNRSNSRCGFYVCVDDSALTIVTRFTADYEGAVVPLCAGQDVADHLVDVKMAGEEPSYTEASH